MDCSFETKYIFDDVVHYFSDIEIRNFFCFYNYLFRRAPP
jgi:hypothetical protein